MKKIYIDINCDVGEGVGNEKSIFPFISSCSIACGGHAGDNHTMETMLSLAKSYIVNVGAHPSYPDTANFGRVSMNISLEELQRSIEHQIGSLVSLIETKNMELHHIKPHGALYNDMVTNKELSNLFLKTIKDYKETTFLYVPPKSVIEKLAIEQGYKIKREAFGDRNYNSDLSLVSRHLNNALLQSPVTVLEHIIFMVKNNKVKTVTNEVIDINADTYCIHGDTPSALQILMYLSDELPKNHIYIKK